MNPELEALIHGVLLDLDGAGVLADYLDENDPPVTTFVFGGKLAMSRGEKLRRRWRMWQKRRAIATRLESGEWVGYLYLPTFNCEEACKLADDAFSNYIKCRLLHGRTRVR